MVVVLVLRALHKLLKLLPQELRLAQAKLKLDIPLAEFNCLVEFSCNSVDG